MDRRPITADEFQEHVRERYESNDYWLLGSIGPGGWGLVTSIISKFCKGESGGIEVCQGKMIIVTLVPKTRLKDEQLFWAIPELFREKVVADMQRHSVWVFGEAGVPINAAAVFTHETGIKLD